MLVFLRIKFGVMAKVFPKDQAKSLRSAFDPIIGDETVASRLKAAELKQLDRELSLVLRSAFGTEAAGQIEETLEGIVGIRSLADSPEAVARRALKRGFIRHRREASTVRDFLADGDPGRALGLEKAKLLGSYLDAFESASHRKS
jgi:hypothetical protein